MEQLGQLVGKPVEVLSRLDVEEDAKDRILSRAKTSRVALLVAGDPMVATTHVDLRLRAQRLGIQTRIIHGVSVASAAAGASGLQSYKFGRTVTIPTSSSNIVPESVYSALIVNLQAGLHSLVLLEVDAEKARKVTIPEAIQQLLSSSMHRRDPLIKADSLVVGLARLEAPDMVVRAGTAAELVEYDFGDPPHCLILPSKLHFVEADALEAFCGARRDLVKPRVDGAK
jgi:diphthine synthase